MKTLITQLMAIGLSDKEAAIYVASLELGEATAADIAKKARLKRTTAYNILPDLAFKGFIQMTSKKGVKYYFVDDVRSLKKKSENELRSIDSLIPELRAIHNIIPQKPKITLYEDMVGLTSIYEDLLQSVPPGGEFLSYAGTRDIFQYTPKKFFMDYMEKRIERKIKGRVITGKTPLSESMQEEDSKRLRETKIIDSDKFDFFGETIIYGDKVALVSYQENFMGIIIESKQISKMHAAVFETLWNSI